MRNTYTAVISSVTMINLPQYRTDRCYIQPSGVEISILITTEPGVDCTCGSLAKCIPQMAKTPDHWLLAGPNHQVIHQSPGVRALGNRDRESWQE